MDEYRLESRAKEILGGMGFRPSDLDRSLTEFSGGWLMRVALSRVLLMDPDLLLLDEPTNHLDLESLLWLEEFLKGFRGALLLVSHDSAFLNRMVHEVLEIDQRKLWTYRGNLDAFAAAESKSASPAPCAQEAKGQQARMDEARGLHRAASAPRRPRLARPRAAPSSSKNSRPSGSSCPMTARRCASAFRPPRTADARSSPRARPG